MVRRRCVAVVTAALLTVQLTACDSTDDSDGPPTTPATVSFPDDPYEAPSVPDPIEPTAFIEKPCTSLTREQQKKFNLDSGEVTPSGLGEECLYRYTSVDRSVRIEYATDVDGLQHLFKNGPGSGKRWEPEVLDGYPAVATYVVDRIAVPSILPSCYYAVGVNDSLYFAVLAQDANGGSECTLAKEIAADALSNIKNERQ